MQAFIIEMLKEDLHGNIINGVVLNWFDCNRTIIHVLSNRGLERDTVVPILMKRCIFIGIGIARNLCIPPP